jgi:hypothetical protein
MPGRVRRKPTWILRVALRAPGTAASFLSSSGSRAFGAVIRALSSPRSEPIGHGSCSRGKVACELLNLLRIGGKHVDDVLRDDRIVIRMQQSKPVIAPWR